MSAIFWGELGLGLRRRAIAVALITFGCLGAIAPTSALATPQVFGFTGTEQTYVVGPGVHSLHVVAIGAPGGKGSDSPPSLGGLGGRGARVEGDLAVTPGQVLYIEVGGAGADGGAIAGGGKGGFNGGGSSNNGGFNKPGGGGGGATDLRTCSATGPCVGATDSITSRLLVAAGGGGGGAIGRGRSMTGGAGGDAGAAGETGQPVGCSTGSTPGAGGGAATQTAGGTGGTAGNGGAATGVAGTLAQGAAAGTSGNNSQPGGGGGGGYYGGGSGGGGNGCSAGGGGGGSSFVGSSVTASVLSSDQTGVPSVTITPDEPPAVQPPPPSTLTPVKPSNQIELGRQVRKFKHRGTALLSVKVPGPGSLGLAGAGLVPPKGFSSAGAKALAGGGEFRLLIRVKGKGKRTLEQSGRLKVRIAVTFTPTGGDPNTLERSITLVKTQGGT